VIEIIISAIVLGAVGFFYLLDGKVDSIPFLNKDKNPKQKETKKGNLNKGKKALGKYKKTQDALPFEKIVTSGKKALVKINDNEYVGIIEVYGVNYNLLSIDEKLLLEEVFQTVLNGISYPIQIITQSKKMDIDNYNNIYNRRIEELEDLLKSEENKVKLLKSDNNSINELGILDAQKNIERLNRQIDYGKNVISFINSIAYNADILDKRYYIATKYNYNSKLFNEDQTEEEKFATALNTISNRLNSIISGLAKANMEANFLDGYKAAELLYMAFNKEIATDYKLKNALRTDFSHFITTAKPIELKIYENEEKKILESANLR